MWGSRNRRGREPGGEQAGESDQPVHELEGCLLIAGQLLAGILESKRVALQSFVGRTVHVCIVVAGTCPRKHTPMRGINPFGVILGPAPLAFADSVRHPSLQPPLPSRRSEPCCQPTPRRLGLVGTAPACP